MHTNFGDSCFSRSRDMIAVRRNCKWVMWCFVIQKLGFYTVYLHPKFNDSSFNRSRDIIGALKFKMGHTTLTTPLLIVICHPYAGT